MSRRPLVFERTRAKTYWERFRDTLGHLPGFVGAWNFLMWLSFQYEDAPAPVWTRYRDILRWIMGFLIGAPILSLVAWQLLQPDINWRGIGNIFKNLALTLGVAWGLPLWYGWSNAHKFGPAASETRHLDFFLRVLALWLLAGAGIGTGVGGSWQEFGTALLVILMILFPLTYLAALHFSGKLGQMDEQLAELDQQSSARRAAREAEAEREEMAGRIATLADVDRMELLGGEGIPIGWHGKDAHGKPRRLRYAGDSHLVTVGPSRSGKGTSVILPYLAECPYSTLVIDPKGQNAAQTARRRLELGHAVYVFNPFANSDYETCAAEIKARTGLTSARYNPLARLNPDGAEFVARTAEIARALVEVDQGRNKHFGESARDLVQAAIMYVMKAPYEDKTLVRVRELVTDVYTTETDEDKEPIGFLAFVKAAKAMGYAPLTQKIARFAGGTEEMDNIRSNAIRQLNFLDDPSIVASMEGHDLDFRELKTRPVTVYLILPFDQLHEQAKWLRLMVSDAIKGAMGRRSSRRVVLLLDEFAQLGYMDVIDEMLPYVAEYKVTLWPFLQNLVKLESLYKDNWRGFLSSAGVQQFFTAGEDRTAKYVSEKAGKRRLASLGQSRREVSERERDEGQTGSSSSLSETWDDVLSQQQVYDLKRDKQIVFVHGFKQTVMADRIGWFELGEFREWIDPNPYRD